MGLPGSVVGLLPTPQPPARHSPPVGRAGGGSDAPHRSGVVRAVPGRPRPSEGIRVGKGDQENKLLVSVVMEFTKGQEWAK